MRSTLLDCTARSAFITAVLLFPPYLYGQANPGFRAHLFADLYYGIDSNDAGGERRPAFLYNHTRTEALQVNLGLLQFAAAGTRVRANLGLMVGSYGEENLALEPDWAKNVFEANVGIALGPARDAWLDIGILPSHLGFESAISSGNPTLSRSLAAENSPYYLSGVRLGGRPGRRWALAALVVTGWQRTAPVDGNSMPSVGTQVAYTPTESITFNWSTFVGTDDPDDTRRMRYFNNFYAQFALSPRVDVTLGLDVGLQQETRGAGDYDAWFTPQAVARYAFAGDWAMAVRAEYYRDVDAVIVRSASGQGTRTWGVSCNLDWRFNPHVLARLEVRHLQDSARNFERDETGTTDRSTSLLGSLAFEF